MPPKLFLKKWFFVFTIIIFNFILALRTSIKFFHFFFWFLVSYVALSFVWLLIEYFSVKLSFERRIIGRIQEGDNLDIKAIIKNDSFFPLFNSVLLDSLTCAGPDEREYRVLIDYLGPKSILSEEYNCLCLQRGRYQLGPFFIYIFDPWGIFFLKKAYFIYSELFVYPQTFNIQKFPRLTGGAAPWFGIETGRISGDEHEFYGVREYKYGDSIKRIHWLSTARKNKLIIKEFQKQAFFRAVIVFNLNKDDNFGQQKDNIAEYTIKIVASVAKYLIEGDISLEIIAHVGEIVHIPFNKGPEHLEDIMKFLTIAQAESKVRLDEIFLEFSKYIPNDSTLILVILDKDWEYLPAILSSDKKNISIIPLVLLSSSFLYHLQEKKDTKKVLIKFMQEFNLRPLLFTYGQDLEEAFKH